MLINVYPYRSNCVFIKGKIQQFIENQITVTCLGDIFILSVVK